MNYLEYSTLHKLYLEDSTHYKSNLTTCMPDIQFDEMLTSCTEFMFILISSQLIMKMAKTRRFSSLHTCTYVFILVSCLKHEDRYIYNRVMIKVIILHLRSCLRFTVVSYYNGQISHFLKRCQKYYIVTKNMRNGAFLSGHCQCIKKMADISHHTKVTCKSFHMQQCHPIDIKYTLVFQTAQV